MPHRRSARPSEAAAAPQRHHPAASLVVISPDGLRVRSVAVDPVGTEVGRARTCNLVLASPHVSRRHAVIYVRDGDYVVQDLGSTNGTRLNGEPVMGARFLRDGDRLAFGDIEVEFLLAGLAGALPEPSQPSSDQPWQPERPTEPVGVLHRGQFRHPVESMRELRAAPGFSLGALALAVCGSVVGTTLTTALGTGQWGTLAGAAIGPVVSTTFSTKRTGERGRVRAAAIAILSVGALLITVTGFSFADRIAGESVIPGANGSTFPFDVTDSAEKPITGPVTDPTGGIQCGTVPVGGSAPCPQPITVTNTTAELLHITGVELAGQHPEDFTADQECAGQSLAPGGTCRVLVQFQPTSAGDREANLLIRSSDGDADILLTGTGETTEVTLAVQMSVADTYVPGSEPSGVVLSEPAGIDCPAACSATYTPGLPVTLIAEPDPGSQVEWQGCDQQDGKTCTVTLEINGDRTVAAQFSLAPTE